MEISFLNKSKAIQPQQVREIDSDPAKNISTEENRKYESKNKVDSAEISSSYSGSFDDKRLSIAKSAILYEVTINTNINRVNELKDSVEKGTYDVPANLIADAILKD